MIKTLTMRKKPVIYHDIYTICKEFLESNQHSCILDGCSTTEWANEMSCVASFKGTIRRHGLPIGIELRDDRIFLYRK